MEKTIIILIKIKTHKKSKHKNYLNVMGQYINKRLPVKTAPVQNGPSPKRPHFRLKRPQAKKKTVKTAP